MNYPTPHIDLYFGLTRAQQRKLDSMGFFYTDLVFMSMGDFKKITKNKTLHAKLQQMKRDTLKVA